MGKFYITIRFKIDSVGNFTTVEIVSDYTVASEKIF